MAGYLKGQIAEIAQLSPETLRFYERSKLIPPPGRTKSGYRIYSEAVLSRLEFIKNAKASGFTLKQIKEMFTIAENRNVSIEDLAQTVDKKIVEIDSRIKGLEEIRTALLFFKDNEHQSVQCPHIQAFLNNFQEK